MEFAICTVAAAPVRKEASHRSEMTNQLLFGETMEILEEKDEWFMIRSTYDRYEGWLTYHMIREIEKSWIEKEIIYVAAGITNPVIFIDQLINAPMGSALVGYDAETRLMWDGNHKYHGTFRDLTKPFDNDLVDKTIQPWLNAPYLWGGKTFMGVDCSGFVQTVFKLLGIRLQRDAYLQAEQGIPVNKLAETKKGDLAFFDNEQGRVIHVGIILGDGRIAHSSGRVRIDVLDEQGIINGDTGKRSHRLYSMRRYF
jgi:hypothetical protein